MIPWEKEIVVKERIKSLEKKEEKHHFQYTKLMNKGGELKCHQKKGKKRKNEPKKSLIYEL